MTDIITYETLYELLRKEKYNQEIQELDKDFFKKVITYLEEKERLLAQSPQDSLFSKEITNTRKQIENARRLIRELYERREQKIIQHALLTSRTGAKENIALLPEERQLFSETQLLFDRYRKQILESMLSNKQPALKQEEPKTIKTDIKETVNKLVRFTNPIPQFVAPDLKVYGPFEKEDLGFLPAKVANTIIKKKRAEEIKSEKE